MSPHVFGIRHHGPGSARSLLRALEELVPDVVLIEGPPEAEEILIHAADPAMKPPVALLIYDPAEPRRCAFYPFAVFSPEWQAIQYGLGRGIPVRFMDLPHTHLMAIERAEEEKSGKDAETGPVHLKKSDGDEEGSEEVGDAENISREQSDESYAALRRDPLRWLAKCAGYEDSERWWEHLIEERRGGEGIFASITEAMSALRQELKEEEIPFEAEREARREAWMRRAIRAAQKEGFERIAVVCGAWHAPALAEGISTAKQDDAILKGLPKIKVAATWTPWTYWRLAAASGYGAGIESPGWYDFLWTREAEKESNEVMASKWLTRAAHLLRGRDLDASTASVIEAVRLTTSLASLRWRALPGLAEMNDAIQAVLLMGEDTALRLIEEKLIVGDRLGEVPDGVSSVPLQQDLRRLQKSLRLPPAADTKDYDFDLRKPNDLERSRLLHRLLLLNIPWGKLVAGAVRSKGTFRESWRLEWKPEFAVNLIEAAIWGNTVESAAGAFARDYAAKAHSLAELTKLVNKVLLADLPETVSFLMERLRDEAAVSSDVPQMMDALPPLADILRYGNVRNTDRGMAVRLVRGLVERVCVGLPAACASLDDEAAQVMFRRVLSTDAAIGLIEIENLVHDWRDVIMRITDQTGIHGLVAGRCARILFDASQLDALKAGRKMALALSRGNDPAPAGAWIEGFLQGSGMVLLHSENLWRILDAWITSLANETFNDVLPLLRRTFSTFPAPERRMMGEQVKRLGSPAAVATRESDGEKINHERGGKTLPIILKILGIEGENE